MHRRLQALARAILTLVMVLPYGSVRISFTGFFPVVISVSDKVLSHNITLGTSPAGGSGSDHPDGLETFFDKFKEFVEISSLEGFHNKVAALFQELLSKPQCFLI